MAFRVDDIVVTERNVLLLSEGQQFIADIERNTDALDDGNFTRDRNPWNFYSSDGVLYHNLFNTSSFDVRTQTLTGSTRHSPNNSRSHESIFMPHDSGYVGGCQFYGNAYTITDFTNSTVSSYVESGFDDGCSVFCSDHGIVRYNPLSSYENPSEYYISPNTLFEPTDGVQFITEYPLNGYYMDFGDNETEGRPTLFGDSVLAKYYLDQNYSVSSYDVDATQSRFRQLRTYYDVGSTGNAIYMVFRNNLNGTSILTDEGATNTIEEEQRTDLGYFSLSGVGCMSNVVISLSSGYCYYSSTPYSDMFEYEAMNNLIGNPATIFATKQPNDHSFILYLQRLTPTVIKLTYVPTIGLERSAYTLRINENPSDLSMVELPHCVVIGTKGSGILSIWSRDYLYDGSDTLVDFNPFQQSCSGFPSFDSLSSIIDGTLYGDIRLFYNNKDMLGATAVVKAQEIKNDRGEVVEVVNQLQRRIAFFSANFDDGVRHYEIGQFFMPAGNPLYEIEVLSSETPVYEEVLSSVPYSSWNDVTEEVNWNYKLQKVPVVTDTETTTSDPFQVSANYVSECDILFDYSSTKVDDELEIGSYAFVQFEKYGLSKCHIDDVYSNDKMVKFSSTGPINRYDSRNEIWTKTVPSDAPLSNVKGRVIYHSDLKTIPDALEGDIYSVINEYDADAVTYEPYTYFRYTTDGNTSSWVETSFDYINGYVGSYADLCNIEKVAAGDTYLVSDPISFLGKTVPAYSFYQYSVTGNLTSWDEVGADRQYDGLILGRKTNYSQLPGHTNDGSTPPNEGDICFVEDSYTFPSSSVSAYSCYIYDKNGADSGQESIIRRWETTPDFKIKTSDDNISNGDYFFKVNGEENPVSKIASYYEMMTNGSSLRQEGTSVILSGSGGTYNTFLFESGECYIYRASDDYADTNHWVNCTSRLKIKQRTSNGGEAGTNYTYIGGYPSFEQLKHSTPPSAGSVYLVRDAYSNPQSKIPENSFYRYGYDENQLDWWHTGIGDRVRDTVKKYDYLKYETNVPYGSYYLVKEPKTFATKTYSANTFYTFGIDGNTSFWSNSATLNDIDGTVDCYGSDEQGDTTLSGQTLVKDGDVYGIRNEYVIPTFHVDKYAFYKLTKRGNCMVWEEDNLSSVESYHLSGYKESYSQIENLSGDLGSYYYTESETEPLVFYQLKTNNSVKFCTDAVFSVVSYSEDVKKPILDVIDYISSDYSTFFISGKPALKSTFISKNGHKTSNSFSDFPLVEREIIKEPTFATVKSVSAELSPVSSFKFALDYPIEDSMGVAVKTFATDGANHDASISLVKWNQECGEWKWENSPSVSGLHLQYNAICTDVYMNGTVLSSVDESTGVEMPQYSSTIYEYPHPCYGELRTAGTGLPIFDGPFSSTMTTSDMFFVNGYFVVKNYSVEVSAGHTEDWWETNFGKNVIESGKHQQFSTGLYPRGGYVVTNFFVDSGGSGSGIPHLYGSELLFSSKEETKTKVDSERFYDYNYLWHIKPVKPMEFYPESKYGKTWSPYYPSKYVDFIEYHNGYYYISLRSKKTHDADTVGYDIIETDTLFEEKECVELESGLVVSGIRFFDGHVAVEYEKLNGERFVKWFDSGKSFYKTLPVLYRSDVSAEDNPMKHANLDSRSNYSSDVVASYDNVEVMNSLNRFTPVVNHKSNLFSIRIEDLGFEESEYLTDYQKKVLRTYFRNSITELVDSVKPAHTQLFDVYLD